jgi:hypothetical protein
MSLERTVNHVFGSYPGSRIPNPESRILYPPYPVSCIAYPGSVSLISERIGSHILGPDHSESSRTSGFSDTRYGTRDTGYGIRDTGYEIRDTG